MNVDVAHFDCLRNNIQLYEYFELFSRYNFDSSSCSNSNYRKGKRVKDLVKDNGWVTSINKKIQGRSVRARYGDHLVYK